jgi:hypothetical protein
LEIGKIISLLSGAGLGAILSAFLVFINNSKKNKLDFVTRERSEWRREIKSIIVDLLSGNNRNNALSRLETLLNPYGRYISKEDAYEFYMNDGHIWEIVDNFDYSNKNVKTLTKYLELLLKYDWERSKREIKYDIFNSFIYCVLIIGTLSNGLVLFFIELHFFLLIMLLLSSVILIGSIIFFEEFNKISKKKMFIGFRYPIILSFAIDISILFGIAALLRDISVLFLVGIIICVMEFGLLFKVGRLENEYIKLLKKNYNKENTHV